MIVGSRGGSGIWALLEEESKRCPKCRSDAIRRVEADGGSTWVDCLNCGVIVEYRDGLAIIGRPETDEE